MRFTEYIYLPSFKVSKKSGCDIRTDGQTDRHDESIRVPLFAIWLRNPKNKCLSLQIRQILLRTKNTGQETFRNLYVK